MPPGIEIPDRREPVLSVPPSSGISRPVRLHALSYSVEDELPALTTEPRLDVQAVVGMSEAQARPDVTKAVAAAWLPSVLIHLLLLFLASQMVTVVPTLPPQPEPLNIVPIDLDSMPMSDTTGSEARPERAELDPMAKLKSPTGTFVSVPPAAEPEQPLPSARYVAETDRRAERETQAERVVQSPTVVAERFSEKRSSGAEAAERPLLERPQGAEASQQGSSEGAETDSRVDDSAPDSVAAADAAAEERVSASNNPKQRGRADGRGRTSELSLFPSSRQLTAILRQGDVGGHGSREGAPDANLLDGQVADLTRVNARGTPYHAFFSAVRRQFNFYYQQAGANLRSQDVDRRVFEKTYTTRFWVRLAPDGKVAGVQIVASSGVPAFDGLVMQALRAASPFPEVPQGLLQEDGALTLGGECRLGVGMSAPTFLPSR